MGFIKSLFGLKTSNINNGDTSKKDQPRIYSELKQKTEELQRDNKEWETEFNKVLSLRKNGAELEQLKQNEEAIKVYLQSIKFGEDSKKLNIYNYAYDIERVIILYSKSRKLDFLKNFLSRNINKYPHYKGIKKWKERLTKLNQKQ